MTDQGTKVNTRALALDFLLETAEKGGYSHVVMRGMLEKYQYLDKKERAFLTRLSEGTLERMLELDAISGATAVELHPFFLCCLAQILLKFPGQSIVVAGKQVKVIRRINAKRRFFRPDIAQTISLSIG